MEANHYNTCEKHYSQGYAEKQAIKSSCRGRMEEKFYKGDDISSLVLTGEYVFIR